MGITFLATRQTKAGMAGMAYPVLSVPITNFNALLEILAYNIIILNKAIHIWSESNLVNFSIPKVLKTVLSCPELALSDPTMVDAEIKNVPVLCTRFKYW